MSTTTEDNLTEEMMAFDGFFEEEPAPAAPVGPPPIILDRSTLQRWSECPHSAFHVDRKLVSNGGVDADVGNAVHAVIARAVTARHTEGWPARQLREFIEEQALASRPDLQPAVLDSLRRTYPLVNVICHHPWGPERAPEDLLKYDGGAGAYGGQLAGDLLPAADDGSRGPIRLTGEVDLLLAGQSVEELEMFDWKSGWKWWTAGDVALSFQFNFYAWLVLRNYPAVNRVRTRVWMTREGQATAPVDFERGKMYAIGARLQSAVDIHLKYRDAKSVEDVPAWPAPLRCPLCPAATRCIEAHSPERDFAADPEAYLRQMIVFESAASRMKEVLTATVRQSGRDLVFDDIAFGIGKPVTPRAKPCDIYDPPASQREIYDIQAKERAAASHAAAGKASGASRRGESNAVVTLPPRSEPAKSRDLAGKAASDSGVTDPQDFTASWDTTQEELNAAAAAAGLTRTALTMRVNLFLLNNRMKGKANQTTAIQRRTIVDAVKSGRLNAAGRIDPAPDPVAAAERTEPPGPAGQHRTAP